MDIVDLDIGSDDSNLFLVLEIEYSKGLSLKKNRNKWKVIIMNQKK